MTPSLTRHSLSLSFFLRRQSSTFKKLNRSLYSAAFIRSLSSNPSPDSTLVEITVDGIPVRVPPGSALIHACEAAGKTIPRFCFHDRLAVAGNCRMCLVEVAKSPKPVASCAMPVTPGMIVLTDSPLVKRAREGVLEFILANHPLDCPICDQAGECDLQDQAMRYGNDRSRYMLEPEGKRAVEDKHLGPLVSTCLTRCIHCTRCVRFANEVAGAPELGTTGRGSDMQIGTYISGLALDSELSGNVVDLCPVGALTSRPYAFRARPWELRPTPSIDVHDAVGSRVRVDCRGSRVMRILPRECAQINEEWISDKTRHACDGLSVQRLTTPFVAFQDPSSSSAGDAGDAREARATQAIWATAFEAVAQKLKQLAAQGLDPRTEIAAVVGETADAESMVVLRDWMLALGSRRLAIDAFGELAAPVSDFRQNYLLNRSIASIDDADAILLVGVNPRHEAAVLNVRLRRAWLRGAHVAIIGVPPSNGLAYDATHIGDDVTALSSLLAPLSPLSPLSSSSSAVAAAAATAANDTKAKLENAKRPLVLVGSGVYLHPELPLILKHLGAIDAKLGGNSLAFLQHGASHAAAFEIGYSAASTTNKSELKCAKLVFLLCADNLNPAYRQHLIDNNNTFIVYIGHHGDVGAEGANVVMPAAAYTEKCATYVNVEGRAQRTSAALAPPGAAREDWTIVRALADYCGYPLPYKNIYELHKRMSALSPLLIPNSFFSNAKAASTAAATAAAAASAAAAAAAAAAAPTGSQIHPCVTRESFYMSNSIARASKTMAECQKSFISASSSTH